MRALLTATLLLCLISACASSERVATKIDCYAGNEDVHVYMTRAWWVAMLPEGTHLELNYDVDLDPARPRPRLYQGLGDNPSLSLWFAAQPSGSFAEVRADGLVAGAPLDSEGGADITGANLNAMLAGGNEIEILLFDTQRNVLRRDHISRADLQAADANLRRLTAELQRRLIAPARRCTPIETMTLHSIGDFEELPATLRR